MSRGRGSAGVALCLRCLYFGISSPATVDVGNTFTGHYPYCEDCANYVNTNHDPSAGGPGYHKNWRDNHPNQEAT